MYEWYSPPFSVHKHLPTNMLYSKCVTVYFLHVSPPLLALREVRDEGPGQPSPWGEHHPAVGRDRGSHLLHPARGHQQKHGECKGSRWHGRHREAGQHNQGQRRQVRYRSSYLSESCFFFSQCTHWYTPDCNLCTRWKNPTRVVDGDKRLFWALTSWSFIQTHTHLSNTLMLVEGEVLATGKVALYALRFYVPVELMAQQLFLACYIFSNVPG